MVTLSPIKCAVGAGAFEYVNVGTYMKAALHLGRFYHSCILYVSE